MSVQRLKLNWELINIKRIAHCPLSDDRKKHFAIGRRTTGKEVSEQREWNEKRQTT